MATNYKAIIESVCEKFRDQLVNSAAQTDAVGRSLLPHFIAAMPAEERANWGVLEKRTSNPYSVPYDILVKKDTREHFDCLTSKAVSGDEKNDKTGPRRLYPTWGVVGKLPKDTWHWCDWRSTQTPITPLGFVVPVPPDPEPIPSNERLKMQLLLSEIDAWIAEGYTRFARFR